MTGITYFIEKTLRLKVNMLKSAVDRPWNRIFLRYTISCGGCKPKVANRALPKLKVTLLQLCRQTRDHKSAPVIADSKRVLFGWKAYFDLSVVLSPLRDIDK
ncbi:hypothetical protein MNBD_GAMMA12-2872 [hydrothermal vent metagenome]|uniref:Uncharacterized protein n=1 Tax=hydrothermal vent metagenome TaxID=652676 RepID=A0A3B0ZR40_9ZZZZ